MDLKLNVFFQTLANGWQEIEKELGAGFTQEVNKLLDEADSKQNKKLSDFETLRDEILTAIGNSYYQAKLLVGTRFGSNTGTEQPKKLESPIKNKAQKVANEVKELEEKRQQSEESPNEQN
jgi:beta-glucosidase/6-phospho-beta-glucosidase/beta-galactosidase